MREALLHSTPPSPSPREGRGGGGEEGGGLKTKRGERRNEERERGTRRGDALATAGAKPGVKQQRRQRARARTLSFERGVAIVIMRTSRGAVGELEHTMGVRRSAHGAACVAARSQGAAAAAAAQGERTTRVRRSHAHGTFGDCGTSPCCRLHQPRAVCLPLPCLAAAVMPSPIAPHDRLQLPRSRTDLPTG